MAQVAISGGSMRSKQKLKRRYYTVNVPQDCETDMEKRFDIAYLTIQDNPRIPYIIPCNWQLVWDKGEFIRICRISRI
jgi:hypothetical protein